MQRIDAGIMSDSVLKNDNSALYRPVKHKFVSPRFVLLRKNDYLCSVRRKSRNDRLLA